MMSFGTSRIASLLLPKRPLAASFVLMHWSIICLCTQCAYSHRDHTQERVGTRVCREGEAVSSYSTRTDSRGTHGIPNTANDDLALGENTIASTGKKVLIAVNVLDAVPKSDEDIPWTVVCVPETTIEKLSQADEMSQADGQPKVEEALQIDEKLQADEQPKVEEALQVDETSQADEQPKVEEALQIDETSQAGEQPKVEEALQIDETSQVEEQPKVEEALQIDEISWSEREVSAGELSGLLKNFCCREYERGALNVQNKDMLDSLCSRLLRYNNRVIFAFASNSENQEKTKENNGKGPIEVYHKKKAGTRTVLGLATNFDR